MEQLNLFDFEKELLKEELPERTVKNQNQINMNTILNSELSFNHQEDIQDSQFKLGDQVKIILIKETLDSETHHYRKYYEPHLIGKVGEVTKVVKKKNNQFSYEVNVYGTESSFEEAELVWIG